VLAPAFGIRKAGVPLNLAGIPPERKACAQKSMHRSAAMRPVSDRQWPVHGLNLQGQFHV